MKKTYHLPPYPTVPSHCLTSQTLQPFSTASSEDDTPSFITLHATKNSCAVYSIYCNSHGIENMQHYNYGLICIL